MKIRDDNYFTIKGWMLNRLGLKGTQLLLYAIIYGFSQDGDSVFKGSVGYLAEFTGVSDVSARSNLKSLAESGLITITAGKSGDVNTYAVNLAKIAPEKKNLVAGDIVTQPKEKAHSERFSVELRQIVEYLNQKSGKRYRAEAYETYHHIQARLREGFSVDDFKRVIDVKVAEWKGDAKMDKYLRPQTLFGSKFQSYLNQQPKSDNSGRSYDLEAVKQAAVSGKLEYKRKQK